MVHISNLALWRGWPRFAFRIAKPDEKLPKLTPQQARDIGLSVHEQELNSFEWPSQSANHPLL